MSFMDDVFKIEKDPMGLTQLSQIRKKLIFRKKIAYFWAFLVGAFFLSPFIIYIADSVYSLIYGVFTAVELDDTVLSVSERMERMGSFALDGLQIIPIAGLVLGIFGIILSFIYQSMKDAHKEIDEKMDLLDPIDNDMCKDVLAFSDTHPGIRAYQCKINKTDRTRPTFGEFLMFQNFIKCKKIEEIKIAQSNIVMAREAKQDFESKKLCEKLSLIGEEYNEV